MGMALSSDEAKRGQEHTRIARLIAVRLLWHPALSKDCTKGQLTQLAEAIAADIVDGVRV